LKQKCPQTHDFINQKNNYIIEFARAYTQTHTNTLAMSYL
jgi:hypothetical protein